MTPSRAQQLLNSIPGYADPEDYCTPKEYQYVNALWHTLPTYTIWYDAVRLIAHHIEDINHYQVVMRYRQW